MNKLRNIIRNVLYLLVTFLLISPIINAGEISEEINEINLYIYGKGGDIPISNSTPTGKLTTKAPITAINENHIFNLKSIPPYNEYWWYSDLLNLNISLVGDVHFTIWAESNESRYISFMVSLGIDRPDGGHSFGRGTESKFVYNEPIEFNAVITKEEIEENDLKDFYAGDRIGIGVEAMYPIPQPPSDVRFLYNSTRYPSHMTINTNSVSIDILNPKTYDEKASVEVVIIDAFGIYDIADYDIQIADSSGKNIIDLEIIENGINRNGKIIIQVIWAKSKNRGDNYIINITVIDNNNNRWEKEEILEFNFFDDTDRIAASFNFLIIIVFCIILVIVSYYFFLRNRGNNRNMKSGKNRL